MPTKDFALGREAEYSMASLWALAAQCDRRRWHRLLTAAIRADHAWLQDDLTSTGTYLDNGSRYYRDIGNHNEFASPELFTPRQVAVYDRAEESILRRACAAVKSQPGGLDIRITKNNINFSMPDACSWGEHECYTCWIPLEQAAQYLTPHLVSRLVYAGAGCLSAHQGGWGFELSQRARHIVRPVGADCMRKRAVFCTHVSRAHASPGAGWTRVSLNCKDLQRCSFGIYLCYGVTGLLFMILNEGHVLGQGLQLKDPVGAMHAFSLDPRLKRTVALASGRRATALQIQRRYWRQAKPFVESGHYPAWTAEVFADWGNTLDQLEEDPTQLADRLDPYLKLSIFDRQLDRAGVSWRSLRKALEILDSMRRQTSTKVVRAVVEDNPDGLTLAEKTKWQDLCQQRMLRNCGIERLGFAARLQALELYYHELGGLFDRLLADEKVNSVVVTPREVTRAMHHPPPGGRAEARSQAIKERYGQGWTGNWQYAANRSRKQCFQFTSPFSNQLDRNAPFDKLPGRSRLAELQDLVAGDASP